MFRSFYPSLFAVCVFLRVSGSKGVDPNSEGTLVANVSRRASLVGDVIHNCTKNYDHAC